MAYTTIDNPELYFQCKLWTGDDSTSNAITFDGSENMQADMIWLKPRTKNDNHRVMDSVRGVTKMLPTNGSGAEETISAGLASFDSNGFTLNTTDSGYNSSSYTYVAWCWKAGTAWSNDASATGVGSLDSSGTKNTTAGFSIISFTGTESGTPSIAHGLSSTPEFIISKARAITDNWMVFHGSFSAQDYMLFNTTAAKASASSVWNSLPSSTVINMGDNAGVNDDGAMIMYAFHSVQGFSKFGSFLGTGNADGAYVYLGFKPAWIIIKKTNSSGSVNWYIFDNKRSPINAVDDFLKADTTDTEGGDGNGYVDFLSNGFKLKTSDIGTESGGTFVYMAFAEAPFVNSNGVPANAR